MTEDQQDAIDAAAAYLETALRMLDQGDVGVARAALRRCAEKMLRLPRWDAINGGTYAE